jgi:hypothetical protein
MNDEYPLSIFIHKQSKLDKNPYPMNNERGRFSKRKFRLNRLKKSI